ncbi:hypothetical protein HanRHA438_Chr10g0435701 [Helianthus annuus]|nr:hypothetical protein HanOQP8_Chr10g0352221 [Helianthus annuus]KAJ0878084.1 hypothetical protein HanRHA438_Chr10g0435701 [Helianthus annuus]KAJ0882372.1 hypothetical protein HanPSC8_Chr10g0408901 [Helianthus annuus]
MPLTMKIQPIDSTTPECFEPLKTVPKSRLRRFFDFSSFVRGSAVADRSGAGEPPCGKEFSDEFEPSSVCLDKMVQNFIEESIEKQHSVAVAGAVKCCRNNHHQCSCVNGVNGNCYCSTDGSEDELDSFNCFGNSHNHSSSTDACDPLKSLVLCETVFERNLLADVAKIVDKHKICKRKDEISRKIVIDGLLGFGYTVSICKSRWEKTSTYPAGEYEYIDAVIEGDRVIIDIDFRSEFEIARSTKSYKAVLQMLPQIFVGKADRLQKIINIVSDAAKQSMKKKGMPLPPWRRADYVKAKWLSPVDNNNNQSFNEIGTKGNTVSDPKDPILVGEFEEEEQQWEPLEIKPKVPKSGGKVVSGLASVIEGK